MVSRRQWLGMSLGAGASLALSPGMLRALQQSGVLQAHDGKLIHRAIPSSGELVPATGLSFSNHPGCADHAALQEVLKTFFDKGGRVLDAMHVNPAAEQFHITAANNLGIQNKVFWSTRGTPGAAAPQPGAAFVNKHIDSLLARIGVPKIDLVMLPAAADPSHLAALKEEKKAGRVRYIGVQTIVASSAYAQLETIMRNEPIDFIGVDYDIANRARVEESILPLAQQRKIGVMAFFPFGNAGGLSCTGSTSLFGRTGNRPLPDWAAEFDAKTWAQFFIKYVLSHPAITVARVGTTKPHHMLDNIGGGIGRLPDEATRKRMAAVIDALPPAAPVKPPAPAPGIALPVAIIDRYVGEYKSDSGFIATIRRDGMTLLVKPGNGAEAPLLARSETRFQDARGPFFEFQLDSQGNVTGAVLEQPGPQGVKRTALVRK